MIDSYDPNNFKDRISKSLNKVAERDLREIDRMAGRGKKNKKPEKLVEAACLKWMRSFNWDVNIYEAKAVYNPDGTYRSSRMKAGVSDCMGITPDGVPIYVEFKAKDRRYSFNSPKRKLQKEFLIKKIEYYAFGVVVDSVDKLIEYWTTWESIHDKDQARGYLMSILPKSKKLAEAQDAPLFPED